MNSLGPFRWKKIHGRESLAICTQFAGKIGKADFVRNVWLSWYVGSDFLFSTQLIESIFWLERRERWTEQIQSCSISVVTYCVTYVASRNAWFVVSNHFRLNYTLYASQLLGPLDASRCSVIHARCTLTACHIMPLLYNKDFVEKEKKWILHSPCWTVSNSGHTTASIDVPSTTGNNQE